MVHPLSIPSTPSMPSSTVTDGFSLKNFVRGTVESLNPYNVAWDIINYRDKKESQDYARALQKHLEEREDTAYQRTAADMRNAGLNPLSMQGTDNAGSEVSQPDLTSGTPVESVSTSVQRFLDNANNTMLALESKKDSEINRRLNTMKTIQEVAQIKAGIKNTNLDSEYKRMFNEHMDREYKRMISEGIYDSDDGFTRQLKALSTFLTTDLPNIKNKIIKQYPFFKYIDEFMTNGTLPETSINYLKENHPIWYFLLKPMLPNNEKSELNAVEFGAGGNQSITNSDGQSVNVHIPYAH